MGSTSSEVPLGEASRIAIECGDCGLTRWRKPSEMLRGGVSLHTPISALGKRLYCPACRDEGLMGKTITVQAWFDRDYDRAKIEAAVLKNQTALSEELLAKDA